MSLKGIGGEKVIYFSTHGAALGDAPNTIFAIMTSSLVDRAFTGYYYLTHDMDLPTPNLILVTAEVALEPDPKGTGLIPVPRAFYAFSSSFIDRYWQPLAPGAFVDFDACESDSPAAAVMKGAVLALGAQVYGGWTAKVHVDNSDPTARFVFDRLLGGNDPQFLEADGFKQRPFEYASVNTDMPLHNYGFDPVNNAQFKFTGNLAVPLTPQRRPGLCRGASQ